MMSQLQVNLDQLVTFYFVAKEKSLSEASRKLFVTAPAVCMKLRALEKRFGVKLIEVKKKKVHLTSTGTMLLPIAAELYRSALRADSLLLNCRNSLRLGVSTALTPLFTPIVTRFKELHPSVSVTFTEGRSLLLIQGLLEFQHDVAIVATPYDISDELACFRIPRPEKLVFVVSATSPLAKKRQISWQELERVPVVLYGEGSLSRTLILKEFEKRTVTPLVAATVESVESMKQFVEQGVGASFMNARNVEEEVTAGKLAIIPVKEGSIELWITIVHHRGVGLPPASRDLLGLIEDHFGCIGMITEKRNILIPDWL